MGLKAHLAKIFAKINYRNEKKWIENPLETQQKTLNKLIASAKNTQFGKDHDFGQIQNYQDFKKEYPSGIMKH